MRSCLLSAFVLFACVYMLSAQEPIPSKPASNTPHKAPAPHSQELFAPYWTTEDGWHTELQMRNNILGQSLTVTPVLRDFNGAEFSLAPVTIAPNEIKSVDITNAVASFAPQLIGSYGSVVFRYNSPGFRNLYAAVMIHDSGHPVAFHLDAFVEATDHDAGSREGIWWLPNDTAKDYFVLTNNSRQSIEVTLTLFDAKGKSSIEKIAVSSKTTLRNSMRSMLQKAGLTGSYGGFKIDAPSKIGSLDTAYLLFDEAAGFSALMKTFDRDPNGRIEQRLGYPTKTTWTTRAPMLALSSPDPALGFPDGTKLQPHLFIRNVTAAPAAAALRFNWKSDRNEGSSVGPTLQLAPNETRLVDVALLQQHDTIPADAHWASVELTTSGRPNDIMATASSYDSTLRYGAQTPFNDQLTYHWEGGEWQVDSTHNSIITAGNGGSTPIKAQFTIYYNNGQQHYDLVQELKPHEQMWVDLGKLIHNQIPDMNRQTLPPDMTAGSYELQDLTDRGVGNLFEGKVTLDKTFGYVAYGCATCCGYSTAVFMYYDPIGVGVESTNNQDVWDIDFCTGAQVSVLDSFLNTSWGTGNEAIATASKAVVTGVGLGNTTNFATGTLMTGGIQSKRCPYAQLYPNGSAVTGKAVYLSNSTCNTYGSNINLIGTWGDSAIGGCQLSDTVGVFTPSQDGGSCIANGQTKYGNTRYCYSTSKNNCQYLTCPVASRAVDTQCTKFLDIRTANVITVPAGCHQ
jgi:hypothetical protein